MLINQNLLSETCSMYTWDKCLEGLLGFVRWRSIFVCVIVISLLTRYTFGDDLVMRVVDTGPGLCCIVTIPGQDGEDYQLIYDAGYFRGDGKNEAIESIRELIDVDDPIDILVLSHTDADHNGVVPEIIEEFWVERVIRTGMERIGRTSRTLTNAREWIEKAALEWGTVDINLAESELPHGATYRLGAAYVTVVSGFHIPPEDWGISSSDKSEQHNAGSIVIRVTYHNKSILLCGDAIGASEDGQAARAAEKYMLDQAHVIPIHADVMVAPHHGAEDASSLPFIRAVSPKFVVFSAGPEYSHPRASVVQRYLDAGLQEANLFRTDLGDNEGDKEWNGGASLQPGYRDVPGDEHVEVRITDEGVVTVRYLIEN